ncbi:MAG TPA: MFS transporter [Bacilli bacterium]|nr:MFS transporter [Bacilli bacterium]
MKADVQHQEKLWTKSFTILTLCNFLLFTNLQMLVPTLPSYVKGHFHAGSLTVSLVTSLFALSAIIARLFAGQMLKRGKRNLMLFLGFVVVLLATAGYYWCGAIVLFLFMRSLYGLGFGMISTTFPTMASNIVPDSRMGQGMGYFGLSTSLAMSIGPSIGLALLGTSFGSLIGGGVLVVATILPLTFLLRDHLRKPMETKAKVTATSTPPVKRRALIPREILLPFGLNFLLSIVYGGLLSFLALFGKEVHLDHVGNFFLVNALAVVLIRPLSGKIFDKKGHVAVILPGAFLLIAALLVLSYAHTMGLLIAAALVFGSGFGMLQPSIQAWMIKEVAPEQRGMANAMFLNSTDLGVAVGAVSLGALAIGAGYAHMYRLSSLFMVVFLVVYCLGVFVFGKRARGLSASQSSSTM